MRTLPKHWSILFLLALLAVLISACAGGVPEASKSYSRAVINRGEIVPAENVRVAEYLNYYEQRFPAPAGNEPLNLDVRLGNPYVAETGGDVWVQIGLQARQAPGQERSPLNLVLVLDRSGSMQEDDKMPYLKESLRVFLHSLRPDDIAGIVAYSDEAEVLRETQFVEDGWWIQNAVAGLQARGSTNLYDGLMLGFQQAERHFDIRRNNRVILLSDGIANVGLTDPARIAADARYYNDRGIYLSTIGLGLDFNDTLLSTLAYQGHGAYHFIDSAGEMERVFQEEVEGLVEKVASDVAVTIEDAGAALQSVVGFEGSLPAGPVRVQLKDMGAGDSQVLVAKFRVNGITTPKPLANIVLTYHDVFGQRQHQLSAVPLLRPAENRPTDPLLDIEVRRNVTIVQTAEALREIDHLFSAGRYEEAWNLAHRMEGRLRQVAADAADGQMVKDADLFLRYQMTLAQSLGYNPARDRPSPLPADGGQSQRWGASPTPAVIPSIEVR